MYINYYLSDINNILYTIYYLHMYKTSFIVHIIQEDGSWETSEKSVCVTYGSEPDQST